MSVVVSAVWGTGEGGFTQFAQGGKSLVDGPVVTETHSPAPLG